MPWTDPTTHIWAAAERLTAANMNTFVEANLAFLFGDTAWTNVATFTNSWTAGAPAPAYILIGRVVYLRGMVTGGTINTAAYTLPAGYRPSATQRIAVPANGAFGYFSITTAGVVTPVAGATTNFSTEGSFTTV